MPYFKLNKVLSKQVDKLMDERTTAMAVWHAFAKRHGGERAAIGVSWGSTSMMGVVFKTEPDKKLFYKDKVHGSFYIPRAGTDARKEMQKFHNNFQSRLCGLLEFNPMQGMSYITLGVAKIDEHYYIDTPDGCPLKYGTRVSDVRYEALLAEAKAKAKAKRKK